MAGVMNLPKGKNDRNTKCTGPVCIPYSNLIKRLYVIWFLM